MNKFKLYFHLEGEREILTGIEGAHYAFGAWNKFKKKYYKNNPNISTRIIYIKHEEIDATL